LVCFEFCDADFLLIHRIIILDIPSPDDFRIVFRASEFKFVLYRHWSVLDAMNNSKCIVTSFKTWEDSGRDRLMLAIGKTGVPLYAIKQRYRDMRQEHRRDMKDNMLNGNKDFRDVKFSSFIKNYGIDLQVSASDLVYCIIALMESNMANSSASSSSSSSYGSSNNLSSSKSRKHRKDATISYQQLWRENFSGIYKALKGNLSMIKRGLREAMDIQGQLVSQCKDIIRRKQISTTGQFNFIRLDSVEDDFLYPLALTRLAVFVMDMLRRLDRCKKPIVIAATNDAIGTDLYVNCCY